MTEIRGLLLSVRRYSFPDEQTGRVIEGAKVSIATLQVDPVSDDVSGFIVKDLPIPYASFNGMAQQCSSLFGKNVVLSCDVQPKGKGFAFVPQSVKLAA